MVALSVSISASESPAEKASPSARLHDAMLPDSMVGLRAGMPMTRWYGRSSPFPSALGRVEEYGRRPGREKGEAEEEDRARPPRGDGRSRSRRPEAEERQRPRDPAARRRDALASSVTVLGPTEDIGLLRLGWDVRRSRRHEMYQSTGRYCGAPS